MTTSLSEIGILTNASQESDLEQLHATHLSQVFSLKKATKKMKMHLNISAYIIIFLIAI